MVICRFFKVLRHGTFDSNACSSWLVKGCRSLIVFVVSHDTFCVSSIAHPILKFQTLRRIGEICSNLIVYVNVCIGCKASTFVGAYYETKQQLGDLI